jgi:cyclopropane-fatty-acyl-phospholipid synthase
MRWDAALAKWLSLRTLGRLRHGRLELVCPEGTCTSPGSTAEPDATIVVHDERFFSRALWQGEIGMGESYAAGEWSSPDLVAVARFALRNIRALDRHHRFSALLSRWHKRALHALRDNSLRGSRGNIAYHYDLRNAFFRVFLDPTMAYSCAYFESPEESLEQAQLAKYERICRKLLLEPGDHLLEIGTGWGGLALYAAQLYGCRVTTTTISREQHDYARELFRGAGAAGTRIELLGEDYRKLRGRYDKLVSVEMFEAVGHERYDEFFGICDRLLRPDGAMLLQTITVPDQRFDDYLESTDWIQTYIFPGSELSSVGAIVQSVARATQLTLHHAEEIGQHYARTLHLWRERFLGSLAEVRAMGFDERFIRTWDYYLAICEASFLERNTGNLQLLMARNGARKPLFRGPSEKPEAARAMFSAAAEDGENGFPRTAGERLQAVKPTQ